MEGPVLHAQRHNPDALSFLVHDQVGGEVLHKEHGVEPQCLSVEGVKHGMACTIRNSSATIGLPTLPKLQGLAAKGTLVDLSLICAREGHAIRLQLDHRARCLLAHHLDCILIAKPIRAFDSVVKVPSPIVLGHISEGCVDPALRSHGVGAGWEQLGNARNAESVLGETHCRTKASTASSDHNSIVGVVDDVVLSNGTRFALRAHISSNSARHR
mmetsp:Transcript_13034/g.26880  ORF Transcript_13034/g.26880 Transcript_13034/m.26880 type:complete len:214 (-) Transcript_13034:92-733(-)